jgi:hypothetical protein
MLTSEGSTIPPCGTERKSMEPGEGIPKEEQQKIARESLIPATAYS